MLQITLVFLNHQIATYQLFKHKKSRASGDVGYIGLLIINDLSKGKNTSNE